jgi:uncharacterized protein (TIGR03435 family)
MKPVALSVVIAALILAQASDSEERVEFEVASIRQAVQNESQDIDLDQDRFRTRNVTLKLLIADAYDIDVQAIFGGPKWVESDGYDITQ